MEASKVNPYALVNVVRTRASQLADGAPPAIDDAKPDYPVSTAFAEVARGKVRVLDVSQSYESRYALKTVQEARDDIVRRLSNAAILSKRDYETVVCDVGEFNRLHADRRIGKRPEGG